MDWGERFSVQKKGRAATLFHSQLTHGGLMYRYLLASLFCIGAGFAQDVVSQPPVEVTSDEGEVAATTDSLLLNQNGKKGCGCGGKPK